MRKLQYTIILSIVLFFSFAMSLQAQTITAGGGVGYGSESEDFNFQVNAYYGLPNLPFRLGGDVGYAKPEDNLTQIEGNANIHLMLLDKKLVSIYGLTGLNVLFNRFSNNSTSTSNTDTGFNAGGGAELNLGFGRAFGEAKYILGREGDEQVVLGVGIRLRISN